MSEHHAQTKPNVIVRLMEVTQWQFFNIEYLGMYVVHTLGGVKGTIFDFTLPSILQIWRSKW